MELRTGFEIDHLLRWASGRAERLAKKGRLPHVILPTGELRFVESDVLATLKKIDAQPAPDAPADREAGK